jgi:simple sugar transport system substrate-binding protein/ribose transport system substrate-binding protein
MNQTRFGIVASLAAVLGIFALSGCDDSTSTPTTTNSGSTTQPSAGGSIKMAGIIFQEDEFFRLIQFGMQDAAKKNGVELLVGNSANSQDKESTQVQNYADQKVAAILVSPINSKTSIPALKAAHDQGILIVTNNVSLASDFPDGDVECSNEDLGIQTGTECHKYIVDKLGGKANIAILAFHSQVAEQSDARTGGFKKSLQDLIDKGDVKIVAEQDAWETAKAQQAGTDILGSKPEINVVYGANEGGTSGWVLAVKQAGQAGKIGVFGTDVSDTLINYLKSDDNILQAITAQKPFEMGQKSMEMALKALHHEPYDKKIVLNGVCLKRSDQSGIDQFQKDLAGWKAAGGN